MHHCAIAKNQFQAAILSSGQNVPMTIRAPRSLVLFHAVQQHGVPGTAVERQDAFFPKFSGQTIPKSLHKDHGTRSVGSSVFAGRHEQGTNRTPIVVINRRSAVEHFGFNPCDL